jgi:3-phenylpropionate/trans-cinnamate dioxygenase ferredoxin component
VSEGLSGVVYGKKAGVGQSYLPIRFAESRLRQVNGGHCRTGGLMESKAENWVAICSSNRLASQTIVCARLEAVDLLLIRDGTQIFACERACPHEQADLGLGLVADGRLLCPRLLASFDLHDGNISAGLDLCGSILHGLRTGKFG